MDILYNKTCLHCKKPFQSPSKGTRYCSAECQQKHAKKIKHQREVTAKQGEASKVISRAYSLCQTVGELYCPKPDDYYTNRSKYRWHHIDGCVLNNSPFNIICVEHTVHEKIHSNLSRINSTEVLRIIAAHPELVSDRQSFLVEEMLSGGNNKDWVLNKDFLAVVNQYRVKSYLSERERAFENLSLLETELKLLGVRSFALKWFRVRTQTDLKKIFRDAGYLPVLEEWLQAMKS